MRGKQWIDKAGWNANLFQAGGSKGKLKATISLKLSGAAFAISAAFRERRLLHNSDNPIRPAPICSGRGPVIDVA